MWILANHADQKMCSVFVSRFRSWLAFGHLSQLDWRMIEPRGPRSQPGYRSILLLPKFCRFFRSDQGIFGTRHNRNVSTPDQFEHAQSVSDLRFEPRVASNDSDAQNFCLRRLNEK